MTSLILTLLLWLSTHTDFRPDMYYAYHGFPVVRVVSLPVLCQIKNPYNANYADSEAYECFLRRNIDAVYDPRVRTIYLRNDLDMTQLYGQAVLLHELVHDLQYLRGDFARAKCPNAVEEQAHTLQSKYIEAHGVDSPYSAEFIKLVSMCPSATP